jgi:hypothetical protein
MQAVLSCEFFVDDCFEALKWLRAGEEPAVDEECGRARDTGLLAVGHVLGNVGLVSARGVALFELVDIKTDFGCILGEIFVRQRLLIGEQLVVVFPEFFLLVGAIGRLGGRACAVVHAEWELAESNADFVAVRGFNLL